MEKNSQHTPTPLFSHPLRLKLPRPNCRDIAEVFVGAPHADGGEYAPAFMCDSFTAERIVRACNAHDELVALVQSYESLLKSDYEGSCGCDYSGGQLEKVRAALVKAGA